MKFDYMAVEDNGGGLHLLVKGEGSVALFSEFEWQATGSLIACMDALDAGDDMSTWEGAQAPEDAARMLDAINADAIGFVVVAWNSEDGRVIRPDRMGRAAQIEFGIDAA